MDSGYKKLVIQRVSRPLAFSVDAAATWEAVYAAASTAFDDFFIDLAYGVRLGQVYLSRIETKDGKWRVWAETDVVYPEQFLDPEQLEMLRCLVHDNPAMKSVYVKYPKK